MVLTVFAILILVVLYWFPIRRWMNQWGATLSDLDRVMTGLLADWTYSMTIQRRSTTTRALHRLLTK
jgi:hypothetical protein